MLVDRIHAEVLAREAEEPAQPAGDPLERRGYLARIVETELFPAAREPSPWLAELVARREASEVAAELAAAEPLDAPDPDDARAATWRIPGPGGHVRHLVAMAALEERDREAKRVWLSGFFARCCEEARAARRSV